MRDFFKEFHFNYLIIGGLMRRRLAVSVIRFWKPSMRGISSNKCRARICMLDQSVFVPRATGSSGFNRISCKYGCGKNDSFDRIAMTAMFNSYGYLAISFTWRKSSLSKGPSKNCSTAIPLSHDCSFPLNDDAVGKGNERGDSGCCNSSPSFGRQTASIGQSKCEVFAIHI